MPNLKIIRPVKFWCWSPHTLTWPLPPHLSIRSERLTISVASRFFVGSLFLPKAVKYTPLTIPDICSALNISQRQLNRQFTLQVNKSPVVYYRDIHLDRARCLVTQTDLRLAEVAVACGFTPQAHFTRSYSQRFGLSPSKDRVAGRVPFEFRAWPMYNPGTH